ncbi:MAG: hypothetical protein DDT37_00769 [Firmicutes bacterium]|nr:hypothetical protein [candidate division NPL-UPA2 bacterium]MBT9155801.1 hypothetical protein [candidate division NPL-UPA2 bacterium]
MNSVLTSVIATVGTRLNLVLEGADSQQGQPELLTLVEEARQEWDAAQAYKQAPFSIVRRYDKTCGRISFSEGEWTVQSLLEHLNVNTVLAGLFVLAIAIIVTRALVVPAKFALRAGLMVLSGAFLLLAFNIALQVVDVFVPINPFTVLLTGYLGPPGLLALLFIQFFLAF